MYLNLKIHIPPAEVLRGGKNWKRWQTTAQARLMERGIWNVVEGTEEHPGPLLMSFCGEQIPEHFIKLTNYTDKDEEAQRVISASLTPLLRKMVKKFVSSQDMWLALVAEFDEERPGDRRNRLLRLFLDYPSFDIRKKLSKQRSKFFWIWRELNFENKKLNSDPLPDYLYTHRLLNILPDELSELKMDWEKIDNDSKTIAKLNELINDTLDRIKYMEHLVKVRADVVGAREGYYSDYDHDEEEQDEVAPCSSAMDIVPP